VAIAQLMQNIADAADGWSGAEFLALAGSLSFHGLSSCSTGERMAGEGSEFKVQGSKGGGGNDQ